MDPNQQHPPQHLQHLFSSHADQHPHQMIYSADNGVGRSTAHRPLDLSYVQQHQYSPIPMTPSRLSHMHYPMHVLSGHSQVSPFSSLFAPPPQSNNALTSVHQPPGETTLDVPSDNIGGSTSAYLAAAGISPHRTLVAHHQHLMYRPTPLINSLDLDIPQQMQHQYYQATNQEFPGQQSYFQSVDFQQYDQKPLQSIAKAGKKRMIYETVDMPGEQPHQYHQSSRVADSSYYPSPDPPKKAKIMDVGSASSIPNRHSITGATAQDANQTATSSDATPPLPLSPQSPFLPNVMPALHPQQVHLGFENGTAGPSSFDNGNNSPFDLHHQPSLNLLKQAKESPISHLLKPISASPLSIASPPKPTLASALVLKPIAIPKKPSTAPAASPGTKKEAAAASPALELPHRIDADNGKKSWELIKSIGKGGCGEVYLGRELFVNQPAPFVAIKIIKDRKQFLSELATMKTLNDHEYGRGYTPKLIMALKKRKALVMEYLSDTISARFERSGYHFSLKTICMLAMNTMSLVRDFNEKTGQAHVDIKPSNLCTSPNGRDLFLIDFGYSTSPHVKLPGQTGTPLFMACNLQTIGATYPSLQDDYESIGYVLMFLISGGKKGLPWGALRTHKEIASSKNDTTIQNYCQALIGTELEPLAQCLSNYLFACRDRSKPFTNVEYNRLYGEWASVLHSCGWSNDKMYDWVEQDSSFNSSLTLINSQSTSMYQHHLHHHHAIQTKLALQTSTLTASLPAAITAQKPLKSLKHTIKKSVI